MNMNLFANELGRLESDNDYRRVNNISGAMGRYQFMPSTLTGLKRIFNLPDWVDRNYFLNSPSLQDQYFEAHINDLENYIRNNRLYKYYGTSVVGSLRWPSLKSNWNKAGMLAAMHLAGTGNVRNYFLHGTNTNDGKTSLTDYGAYFSDKFSQNNAYAGFNVGDSITTGIAFILGIALYWVYSKN